MSPGALTTSAVVTYCACSSLMLLVNKLTIYHLGAPAFITFTQFAFTTLAVLLMRARGWIESDWYEWSKVRYFILYVCCFAAGTWANMKVLASANVETIIVFRACTPLFVSVFDYVFHKRDLPGSRSVAAMLLILAGATNYVLTDRSFLVDGYGAYFWVRRDPAPRPCSPSFTSSPSSRHALRLRRPSDSLTQVCVWMALLIFQLTYGKYLVSSLGLKSVWTAVLYTNSLSLLPTLIIGISDGEIATVSNITWTASGNPIALAPSEIAPETFHPRACALRRAHPPPRVRHVRRRIAAAAFVLHRAGDLVVWLHVRIAPDRHRVHRPTCLLTSRLTSLTYLLGANRS